jgi:hypothetical protein
MEYYFKKGGNVELALANVIDKASHMQADGEFADLDAPAGFAAAGTAGTAAVAAVAAAAAAGGEVAVVRVSPASYGGGGGGGGGFHYPRVFAMRGQVVVMPGDAVGSSSSVRLPTGERVEPADPCANDVNFDGVFEALLGAQNYLTRRLQGCKRVVQAA